jgi:hypothetical protein
MGYLSLSLSLSLCSRDVLQLEAAFLFSKRNVTVIANRWPPFELDFLSFFFFLSDCFAASQINIFFNKKLNIMIFY